MFDDVSRIGMRNYFIAGLRVICICAECITIQPPNTRKKKKKEPLDIMVVPFGRGLPEVTNNAFSSRHI